MTPTKTMSSAAREASADTAALAAWSVAAEGSADLNKLLRDLGADAALRAAGHGQLGLGEYATKLAGIDGRAVLEQLAQDDVHPLTPADADWPVSVGALGDAAPVLLWRRGVVPTGPRVAVVGSRAGTSYGAGVAADIGAALAAAGVCTVTTGAYGIAAAATQGALGADGAALVLSPVGAGRLHPQGNADLLRQVLARGAVLAERGPGVGPSLTLVRRAHTVLAALADVVVVVEASAQSDTRAVVWAAHQLRRPVGAVPGPVTSVTSQGPHAFVREGLARLVCSGQDVLDLLEVSG